MFERFTDRARRAIVVAQERARDLQHPHIAPGHLLLALSEEESGIAATALRDAGVDAERLRTEVAASVTSDAATSNADRLPFSRDAKKCLELALREALQLGHGYIGTEHLLLGAVRLGGTGDDEIEELLGVRPARVRDATLALVGAEATRRGLSPALCAAMDRARKVAGTSAMTSGHLLASMLEDVDSQASRALRAAGASRDAVLGALEKVPAAGTSDAAHDERPIELRIGTLSVNVTDPSIAAKLRSVRPEEVVQALDAYLVAGPAHEPSARGPAGFTDRARTVLTLAEEEARLSGRSGVGTEDLLLGLVREEEGAGTPMLASSGVSLGPLREAVRGIGEGRVRPERHTLPFTPGAKKVLARASRVAARDAHRPVGPEHLLLGLLEVTDSTAPRALAALGVDPVALRERVSARLAGGAAP
jgi:ATP-dependent Clp protease ATP-binding subunit ClpA